MTSKIDRIKSEYNVTWLKYLLPDGYIEGKDYVALNPTRNDKHIGSFRIDIGTGKFHDFATGDKGGDVIDLFKYLKSCNTSEAIKNLEDMFLSKPFFGNTNIPSQKYEIESNDDRENIRAVKRIWLSPDFSRHGLSHEYLTEKGINNIGNCKINQYTGDLLVPFVSNFNEKVPTALQFIDQKGYKRFSKNTTYKGKFHICPSNLKVNYKKLDNIIICEGVATGLSISESINIPNTLVIVAGSKHNLRPVGIRINEIVPEGRIILACDNDDMNLTEELWLCHKKAGINHNMQETITIYEELKQEIGKSINLVLPFKSTGKISKEGYDFNDLYLEEGKKAVNKFFSFLRGKK